MSVYTVPDHGCCKNTHVYGLDESIKYAKYPMSVNPDSLTSELTSGICALAQSGKGEGHDTWLQGIGVQFELTFTVKAWTEAERYHHFEFISSQSTMHRISKFNLDTAYIEYTDPRIIEIVRGLVDRYNETNDPEDYLRLLYSNPCGMKLSAGMTTNYRQLKTIYAQRKNHRLPEWRDFCAWIETLPMADKLIIPKKENVA